ncbi:hypothetical protein Taro_015540 [Colocasia esculenta]|uniref:Uncharacterized protein n=1 Tax=Colocasia esculenta TaxID=4460 RepID=A0A843UMN7_COLES|nr:hypothetical protein [Colocasia esculenta]
MGLGGIGVSRPKSGGVGPTQPDSSRLHPDSIWCSRFPQHGRSRVGQTPLESAGSMDPTRPGSGSARISAESKTRFELKTRFTEGSGTRFHETHVFSTFDMSHMTHMSYVNANRTPWFVHMLRLWCNTMHPEMDGYFSLHLVRNGSNGPTLGSPSLGISRGTLEHKK